MDIERINQIESKNADWCDDCHGYTHMPWCPSYKEPDTRRSGEVDHRTNHEQPASEYQPAALGGGEVWDIESESWLGRRRIRSMTTNQIVAVASTDEQAQQIIAEHNQYHSLVANDQKGPSE